MIDTTRHSLEFESVVDEDGMLHLPKELANALRKGTKITVRVTGNVLSKEMKARKIEENEIERIASLQIEPRTQVVKFLLAEGALAENKSFMKRTKLLMRA
ncbi:MAG: hypothetical protein AAB071_03740 [Bacteroidota bacterium]